MTEQVTSLQSFSYLSLLETSTNEKIYRLVYDDVTRYFQVTSNKSSSTYRLLEPDGSIISGSTLDKLWEKVTIYERLFGKSLERERLSNWLRIDEVPFLLEELTMNRPDLENRIYERLELFVNRQSKKSFYDPFLLPKIMAHSDFVFDYLQTNIGHPDGTENYFNRMKIMIQQIGERTAYIDVPSNLRIIQSILKYINEQEITSSNVILRGKENYCVVKGGLQTLPESEHQFTGKELSYQLERNSTVISIDNPMIHRLIKIYNELEFEYTRQ